MNVPYDFRGNAILGWVPGVWSMDFMGISRGSTMDLTGISREDMDFTVKRCDCTGHKCDATRRKCDFRWKSEKWFYKSLTDLNCDLNFGSKWLKAMNFPWISHDPPPFRGLPAPWGLSVMFSGGHIDDPIFQWPVEWTSWQPTLRVFNAAEDAFFHQGEGATWQVDVLGVLWIVIIG